VNWNLGQWIIKIKQRMRVADIRKLRRVYVVTRNDRTRNKLIRESVGVASTVDKIRESRLRWFSLML